MTINLHQEPRQHLLPNQLRQQKRRRWALRPDRRELSASLSGCRDQPLGAPTPAGTRSKGCTASRRNVS